jgi:hypothetical protein
MINLQTLLTGWNFMRLLRLFLGIVIAVQAVESRDAIPAIVASFLLFQAITNTGCCGMNSCASTPSKSTQGAVEEVEYEEIKSN